MNPQATPLSTLASPARALAAPERQLAVLVQDAAGFVGRGLAILLRERLSGDLAGEHERACALIESNDLAALARLLREQPELLEYRRSDGEGFQLLHWAARRGTPAAIGLLLEHGAPLDSPSGHLQSGELGGFLPGATPLLVACEAGREAAALALLAAGADASASLPGRCETALHFAAGQGRDALLEALIAAGADIDAMSSWHSFDDQLGSFCGASPLHVAALNNCAGTIYLLLKAGAQRDLAGADRRTPLHYAAARGAVAALEVLLAAGADQDAAEACELDAAMTGLSPLHYAVLNGHQAAAAMLLCYGANPRQVEPASGENALQMAERSEDAHLIALLARAVAGEAPEAVFSPLDDQYISCLPESYGEMRAFLLHLLSEFPVGRKSLLILSDWLAEMLGAENRPHLARAAREADLLKKG